jgi:hypothetical protein
MSDPTPKSEGIAQKARELGRALAALPAFTITPVGENESVPFTKYGLKILTPEGEGWLEIRMCGNELEIRGMPYCKTGGHAHTETLLVRPSCANVIRILRERCA